MNFDPGQDTPSDCTHTVCEKKKNDKFLIKCETYCGALHAPESKGVSWPGSKFKETKPASTFSEKHGFNPTMKEVLVPRSRFSQAMKTGKTRHGSFVDGKKEAQLAPKVLT